MNGLLELGAGFNPEETGRQNVLINAAILGVPAGRVSALVDRIAEFADIGKFIDQPIKVYSSGMAVRLGFALQICIPCDVLIVDEALAVGDELFQRKCFGALERFRAGGRDGAVREPRGRHGDAAVPAGDFPGPRADGAAWGRPGTWSTITRSSCTCPSRTGRPTGPS